MSIEIEKVAKGLTEAQRAMILAAKNLYAKSWILPEFDCYRKVTAVVLQRKGLAELFFGGPARQLTPLGLAVRAHLAGDAQ